jgi:hypothetical protein
MERTALAGEKLATTFPHSDRIRELGLEFAKTEAALAAGNAPIRVVAKGGTGSDPDPEATPVAAGERPRDAAKPAGARRGAPEGLSITPRRARNSSGRIPPRARPERFRDGLTGKPGPKAKDA